MEACSTGVYRPRNPLSSPLYGVVSDYYETFKRCYPERYEKTHGFLRYEVEQAFFKFLDCGDVKQGFARIRCADCGETRLLAFSCKIKSVCPSCSVRRSLEFGEWFAGEVVGDVPIRSITFTIPKMLRVYFRYDQSLYCSLARCAYETINQMYQAILDNDAVVPGMISGIHSFGNHVNFHPHVHAIVSHGVFDAGGTFYRVSYVLDEGRLAELFRHKVLKMLTERDKIDEAIIERLMSFHHSGFNVHLGKVITPGDKPSQERAARYLTRSCVSLEKLRYYPEEGLVIYGSPGKQAVTYNALDFLALLSLHVPDMFQRRVIAYGEWSNKTRGMRKKTQLEPEEQSESEQVVEPVLSSKAYRKRWAAWIKKVWNTDPLVCPKCSGKMSIISFIDEFPVVKKILLHLNLWEVQQRAPPKCLVEDDELAYDY